MSKENTNSINISRAKTAIADFSPRAKCFDMYIRTTPSNKLENAIIDAGKIKKSDKILDLACGTGFFLKSLPPETYKCGVDICHSMLVSVPNWSNARKVRAHACILPFNDGVFDVAICLGAINIFEDSELELLLNEVKRVLNDNGRFIVNASVPSTPRLRDYLLYPFVSPPLRAHALILSTLFGCNIRIKYFNRNLDTLTYEFRRHFENVQTYVRKDLRRAGFDMNSSYGLIVCRK